MLGFLDESGDTGLKIGSGSSSYFVVALVTFDDHAEALRCDQCIGRLRSELRLASSYEFRFSKNSRGVRRSFIQAACEFEFSYHVFALDKEPPTLQSQHVGSSGSLYYYVADRLFQNARPYLKEATILLDRHGDRKARTGLANRIRGNVNITGAERLIRKVRQQDSHRNNLLQLADYVAGISRGAIEGKPEAIELQNEYLRVKEATREIWPK